MTVLASAIIVLVALTLLFTSAIDPHRSEPAVTSTATTSRATSTDQPPDLSSMTPREAADRLFNRVMMADEQGNRAEVEQFTPMAVSAYEMLESLDADALFHVGLIYAAAGEVEKAEEYNERLKAIVPNHLLAAFLEHRLAIASDKPELAKAAAKRFLDHYEEEIAVSRSEYNHHGASIERFRTELSKQ